MGYAPELAAFTDATHLLGILDGELVNHALWYTRRLQIGDGPLLRPAYVEDVATAENFRCRGYASMLMERLVAEVGTYDLAALSPSNAAFYAYLGWELWRGPLAIRTETGLRPSPADEEVMIYHLSRTHGLDYGGTLSAEWREGEQW